MTHTFETQSTCASLITFDKAEDGTITNIAFQGGCNGNLKAIAKLLDGMKAEEIYSKLKGNTCGRRPTSCADQLAIAVMES